MNQHLRRLGDTILGRIVRVTSQIYRYSGRIARTFLIFDHLQQMVADLLGFPNNQDALGLFCRATYGALHGLSGPIWISAYAARQKRAYRVTFRMIVNARSKVW